MEIEHLALARRLLKVQGPMTKTILQLFATALLAVTFAAPVALDDGPGAGGGYIALDDGPGSGGGYGTVAADDGPGVGGGYIA